MTDKPTRIPVMTPAEKAVNFAARAICRERCAFMGEPPCWQVTPEGEAWPPPACSEPGCMAAARAAVSALVAAAAEQAATPPKPQDTITLAVWRRSGDGYGQQTALAGEGEGPPAGSDREMGWWDYIGTVTLPLDTPSQS